RSRRGAACCARATPRVAFRLSFVVRRPACRLHAVACGGQTGSTPLRPALHLPIAWPATQADGRKLSHSSRQK
ncbi:MAG: hypothetical protein WBD23_00070, partial [Candidatus Acidiferrales bacterium]